MTMIGLAFGGGVLLSTLIGGSRAQGARSRSIINGMLRGTSDPAALPATFFHSMPAALQICTAKRPASTSTSFLNCRSARAYSGTSTPSLSIASLAAI